MPTFDRTVVAVYSTEDLIALIKNDAMRQNPGFRVEKVTPTGALDDCSITVTLQPDHKPHKPRTRTGWPGPG